MHALLALMLLQVSRLPARVDEAGDLLLLGEQDESGIAAIERIEANPALSRYYLLPAALGRLWLETGDAERAAAYYREALARPCSAPERRFLERRLTRCERPVPR